MKTTEEIYNEIIAKKESGNYPELDELNSTSKVAIWRLWVWIFAFFSKTLWELFENLKAWVTDYFARKQVGTLLWWIDQVKAFQYGDELQFIDGIWRYETIDETKQIVKQVAIGEQNRIMLIKVAKDDTGELTSLSSEEQQSLAAYVAKIKIPGQFINIISLNVAKVNISYRIYYNPEIAEIDITNAIKSAINNYFRELLFNGEFIPTNLTDSLQKIKGVVNPIYVSAEAQEYGTNIWHSIDDRYVSVAGYMKLNNLSLNLISNV